MKKISSLGLVLLTIIGVSFVPLKPSWVGAMCAAQELRQKAVETQLSLLRLPEHSKESARTIADLQNLWILPYGLYAKRALGYSFDPAPANKENKFGLKYIASQEWDKKTENVVKGFLSGLDLPSQGINLPITLYYQDEPGKEDHAMSSMIYRNVLLNYEYSGTVYLGRQQIATLASTHVEGEKICMHCATLGGIVHELGHIACGHVLHQPAYIQEISRKVAFRIEPHHTMLLLSVVVGFSAPFLVRDLWSRKTPSPLHLILPFGLALTRMFPSISQYEEWEADAYSVRVASPEILRAKSSYYYQRRCLDSIIDIFSTHPSYGTRAAFFAKAAQKKAMAQSQV